MITKDELLKLDLKLFYSNTFDLYYQLEIKKLMKNVDMFCLQKNHQSILDFLISQDFSNSFSPYSLILAKGLDFNKIKIKLNMLENKSIHDDFFSIASVKVDLIDINNFEFCDYLESIVFCFDKIMTNVFIDGRYVHLTDHDYQSERSIKIINDKNSLLLKKIII